MQIYLHSSLNLIYLLYSVTAMYMDRYTIYFHIVSFAQYALLVCISTAATRMSELSGPMIRFLLARRKAKESSHPREGK